LETDSSKRHHHKLHHKLHHKRAHRGPEGVTAKFTFKGALFVSPSAYFEVKHMFDESPSITIADHTVKEWNKILDKRDNKDSLDIDLDACGLWFQRSHYEVSAKAPSGGRTGFGWLDPEIATFERCEAGSDPCIKFRMKGKKVKFSLSDDKRVANFLEFLEAAKKRVAESKTSAPTEQDVVFKREDAQAPKINKIFARVGEKEHVFGNPRPRDNGPDQLRANYFPGEKIAYAPPKNSKWKSGVCYTERHSIASERKSFLMASTELDGSNWDTFLGWLRGQNSAF